MTLPSGVTIAVRRSVDIRRLVYAVSPPHHACAGRSPTFVNPRKFRKIPGMDDAPSELVEFLAPYPESVREVMLEGRAALRSVIGAASELVYDATTAVCDGFSYTADVKGGFVNLAAYSDHATLVFGYGALLSDPEARLKGGGKQVRHMRLASAADILDPYVVGLIHEAEANAPKPSEPIEPRLVVKIYQGPKRRPQ